MDGSEGVVGRALVTGSMTDCAPGRGASELAADDIGPRVELEISNCLAARNRCADVCTRGGDYRHVSKVQNGTGTLDKATFFARQQTCLASTRRSRGTILILVTASVLDQNPKHSH